MKKPWDPASLVAYLAIEFQARQAFSVVISLTGSSILQLQRGGSIGPNPEGRIIKNKRPKIKKTWLNRKAKFDCKAENSTSMVPT